MAKVLVQDLRLKPQQASSTTAVCLIHMHICRQHERRMGPSCTCLAFQACQAADKLPHEQAGEPGRIAATLLVFLPCLLCWGQYHLKDLAGPSGGRAEEEEAARGVACAEELW